MKILLLGKNGQLGWEMQRSFAVLGDVVALDRSSAEHCGDLTNLAGLADTVRALQPQVIVNAAAYTAVDKAESEPSLARSINAAAPAVLAEEAARIGALLVHYSSDYVFDGSGNRPWAELDVPAPVNVYGQTKLEGEQAIQAAGPNHLILRTSWVYAARGGNFGKTMLKLARERDSLQVINDQFGAPTGAELLADASAHAIRQLLQRPADAGLYHLAASGETSWYEYAKYVLAQSIRAQAAPEIIATAVHPVTTSAFPIAAKRPLNSRLDTTLFQATFGLSLPHWQPGVARMLEESSSVGSSHHPDQRR